MTLDEAQAIAKMVGTCGCTCEMCSGEWIKALNERFRDFVWDWEEGHDPNVDCNVIAKEKKA